MNHPITDRRTFLRWSGAAAAAVVAGIPRRNEPSFAAESELARFPEKTDLILLTDRPPNLETPIKFFKEDLTPNDAFFVRWHLGVIPTSIDPATFRLSLGGHVESPLSLSLDELRKNFEPASVVAVCQCSGNSRSFYEPRVPGGQWGHGAVGNAKWTGVRLSDLFKKAKIKGGPVDVSLKGLDRAPMPTTPDFVKALSFDHANDGEVIVAYAMNDKPLPMLNGYPLRLIVPGWYATYWVKSLSEINVLPQAFKGFWMDKGYRVPDNPDCQELPTELAKQTVPISRMTVRSLFTTPTAGERISAGQQVDVQGVAFDEGKGIKQVEVSIDGGHQWSAADLDAEIGRYSWRRWRFGWTPGNRGQFTLMVRATNLAGRTQAERQWNRGGYARNVIESVEVSVV
ncbi:MAG TPA: molybdopterin-dependent oxidoreductase [Tepidisphaeraceae bacterium]|jgi:DMSO/TMAO reductase YedYZ molybdopterin-dependent catalytic subunit